MDREPESIQVPVVWVGIEEVPIFYVNQFIGQSGQDEFFLNVGQLTPPPLIGTPEQQAEQARQISYVPVKPVARLGLNRVGVETLIRVLQETLTNYDEARNRQEGW